MKFLIIGLGSIGKRHITNILKVEPNSQFSAFRQRNLLSDDFAKKYNITVYKDLKEAFDNKYDAVFITNPTSEHIPFALKAAKNDLNLFIEKPISSSFEGINDLRNMVKKKKLITFVGYNMRFHPAIKKIKDSVAHGVLGKLYFARLQVGEYLPDFHPGEDYTRGYSARKSLGGGALLTLIHELDYLLWFKGKPRNLAAMMSKVSNLKIDVEDNAELLLAYEDGFIAEININYLLKDHRRNCLIAGEKGLLDFDYYKNELTFFDNEKRKKTILWKDDSFQRNDMYLEEIKHFIGCLKKNRNTDIDLEEGLKSLKVALKAKESHEKNKFLKLTW